MAQNHQAEYRCQAGCHNNTNSRKTDGFDGHWSCCAPFHIETAVKHDKTEGDKTDILLGGFEV